MQKSALWLVLVFFFLSSLGLADTLILKDGTKHSGTLVGATSKSVSFREGTKIHRYLKSNIESIDFVAESTASTATSSRLSSGARQVSLPAGTEITVMANQEIDSKTATEGQVFPADVAENVMNDAGQVLIPKGSEAQLVIRRVSSSGTVTGSSELALDLQSIKVGNRRYTVSTEEVQQKGREGLGTNKRTAEMVGGGAVLGTLIGAVAGGGKGAAIGAATGAAAGAGAQVLTRGKAVKVPAETKLRFKLDQPLRLQAAY
jgi:outer membrane lipoprotein SlyB